jgi:tRNA pseudouridine38-40 synthase
VTTFKLLLEYDGTRYSGWQDQKNARTIMGELKKAAREIFGEDVEMQGAGRTDAGVHALGQVMHMKVSSQVRQSPAALRRRLNDLLPADIAVLEIERAEGNFHARHRARSRTYIYQISTRKQAFTKRFVWWIKDDLDIKAIQKAAAELVGRHDFVCFRAADAARPNESTIVEVVSVEVEREEDIIQIRIQASHFIWRMVRRIVGVLVKVGTGELRDDDFRKLLSGRCDPKLDVAAWTAPASGLLLERVEY